VLTQARVHRFKTVHIGPVTARDVSFFVLVREPPALSGGRQFPDAVIGQDLLRNRRVWFSIATGGLFMSRTAGDAATATGH
jgi:hypothetical protein